MLVGTQKLVTPESFRLYAEKKYKNGDFFNNLSERRCCKNSIMMSEYNQGDPNTCCSVERTTLQLMSPK